MQHDRFVTAQVAEVFSVADCQRLEGLPSGFMALPGGIYEECPDEEAEPEWLCSPLVVAARFREASGKGWGRIVEIENPEGRAQCISLLDGDLEAKSGAVRASLASRGLRMRSGSKAREAVTRLIREWQPVKIMTSTDRLGWADRACAAFVQADGRVFGAGSFHFIGNDLGGAEVTAGFVGAGDEWRDNVAALCAGNPIMILSVSLAFAAPLLEFMNEEGGGLHLRGASSCGKTTIQRVATSVWRKSSRVGSWRATANGIEAVAKAFNSTLLSLDEIAEIDGRHLGEAIYLLANGTGKTRANAHGGANRPAEWRVAILSTGEISVAEKLSEAGRRVMAGQDIRLIDLEADSGRYGAFDDLHGSTSGAAFSDRLKRASAHYHGTAGPAFVEWLMRNRAKIVGNGLRLVERLVNQWNQEFLIADDAQALRAARRLAVIAVAGELAGKADLTGWRQGDAMAAAKFAVSLWLDGRKTTLCEAGCAAKDRTRAFLLANSDGFTFEISRLCSAPVDETIVEPAQERSDLGSEMRGDALVGTDDLLFRAARPRRDSRETDGSVIANLRRWNGWDPAPGMDRLPPAGTRSDPWGVVDLSRTRPVAADPRRAKS